ncbi:hypothetical protein ACJIZ3_010339 [Penstemon smallii]|uniref:Uncharacterized protein n=1 Tax=Penstemon smallii TaxID=265156 RepID=A0ABD3TGY6_9LAMI
MGISEKNHQMDGSVVDCEKWVISGISMRSQLKPIFTKPMEKKEDEEECAVTPTYAESRICTRLVCPPAPKKRKSASKRCNYGGVRQFFNPPDLETIFTSLT